MKRIKLFSPFCVIVGCAAATTAAGFNRPVELNTTFQTDNAIAGFLTELDSPAALTSETTIAFATDVSDPDEKILKIFHRDFPNARNETLYHVNDSYIIYFKDETAHIAYRIYYNANGDILKTIKYYNAEDLDPFIRSKVNLKYKDENISSVTDVTDDSGHFYQIVLEDSKSWVYLNVNEQGFIQVEKKLRKQK